MSCLTIKLGTCSNFFSVRLHIVQSRISEGAYSCSLAQIAQECMIHRENSLDLLLSDLLNEIPYPRAY